MPLVVNIIENLDSALSDNKDHMTAIEEFTHTNELLMKQYEKEKQRCNFHVGKPQLPFTETLPMQLLKTLIIA